MISVAESVKARESKIKPFIFRRGVGSKATSYAVRKCYQKTAFLNMGPKIRFLCYQKRPFLIRHFLIKFSDSPILLEKMLLEKDFNSYRMTVSQP